MKKTFLNREKPALTCMVQAYTAEMIKELDEFATKAQPLITDVTTLGKIF